MTNDMDIDDDGSDAPDVEFLSFEDVCEIHDRALE